jgi:hypothetical protein
MQSNLIDVNMCTFMQEYFILEIKILQEQQDNRQAQREPGPTCHLFLPPARTGWGGANGTSFSWVA